MALIIKIEPGEKISIGEAVISFDGLRSRLSVTGDIPILRQKDMILEEDVDSPCKEIYFLLQRMYRSSRADDYLPQYTILSRDIMVKTPTTAAFFTAINEKILNGHYYQAMKEGRKLVVHEEGLDKPC